MGLARNGTTRHREKSHDADAFVSAALPPSGSVRPRQSEAGATARMRAIQFDERVGRHENTALIRVTVAIADLARTD